MPKLHSLKELTFENVSKLKTIPKELYLLPNLEKLRVINCPDLEEIEVGISLLNKLVFLDIERNPKLKKLPSDIDAFGRDIFGLVSLV